MEVLVNTKDRTPNIGHVARVLQWPVEEWAGNCYAVSCSIVRAKLVSGTPRYGHWLGKVHRNSTFQHTRLFQRHGWIERKDGVIVDVTRWAFECKVPYIWVGLNDGTYDLGANKMREAFLTPPPKYNPGQRLMYLALPKQTQQFVRHLLDNPPCVTDDHVFWLSNIPLQMLGGHAKAVYKAIVAVGKSEYIPFDNRELVLKG